jgi:hypothetical protein
MSRNTSKLAADGRMTVGDLITELCRWPDHATLQFRCTDKPAALCFSHVEGLSKGVVEIELQPAPETVPIVPA